MLRIMKEIWQKSINPLEKNNCIADHEHWPASIKPTCQWFPFHAIMEYTGNIMQDGTHLTALVTQGMGDQGM